MKRERKKTHDLVRVAGSGEKSLVANEGEGNHELDELDRGDEHATIAAVHSELSQEVVGVHEDVNKTVRDGPNPSRRERGTLLEKCETGGEGIGMLPLGHIIIHSKSAQLSRGGRHGQGLVGKVVPRRTRRWTG